MQIHLSPKFKRSYKKIPSPIQDDFDEKIIIFMEDISSPKLKTHKLKGKLQHCLSFYLCNGYRVLFEYSTNNSINLLDIGSHDQYSKWRN
jgi:addiction module RelE/StbE family toxin